MPLGSVAGRIILGLALSFLALNLRASRVKAQFVPANSAASNAQVSLQKLRTSERLAANGDTNNAIKHLEASLLLMPRGRAGRSLDAVQRHRLLAWCYAQVGQLDDAASQIDSGLSVFANHLAERRSDVLAGKQAQPGDSSLEFLRHLAAVGELVYRHRQLAGPLSSESRNLQTVIGRWNDLVSAEPPDDKLGSTKRAFETILNFGIGRDEKVWNSLQQENGTDEIFAELLPTFHLVRTQESLSRGKYEFALTEARSALASMRESPHPCQTIETILLWAGIPKPSGASRETAWLEQIAQTHLLDKRSVTIAATLALAEASLDHHEHRQAKQQLEIARALLSRRAVSLPRLKTLSVLLECRSLVASGTPWDDPEVQSRIARVIAFASGGRATPMLYQCESIRSAKSSVFQEDTGEVPLHAHLMTQHQDMSTHVPWQRDLVDAFTWECLVRSRFMVPAMEEFLRGDLSEVSGHDVRDASDALISARYLASKPLGGRRFRGRQRQSRVDGQDKDQLFAAESRSGESIFRRSAIEDVFSHPNRLEVKSDQPRSRVGKLTFVFLAKRVIATASVGEQSAAWSLPSSRVRSHLDDVLSLIGVRPSSASPASRESQTWQHKIRSFSRQWLPDQSRQMLSDVDSLIIVPDGPLWYFPFGILEWDPARQDRWNDRFEIRYSPLSTDSAALKVTNAPNGSETPIGKKASLQRQVDLIDKRFKTSENSPRGQDFSESVPESVPPDHKFETWQALLARPKRSDFAIMLNRSSTLPEFLSLAQNLPRGIGLPKFASRIAIPEIAARGPRNGEEIQDLFLRARAAGIHHVIISRWPTDDEPVEIVLREFIAEVPHEPIPAAWRRAIQILQRSNLGSCQTSRRLDERIKNAIQKLPPQERRKGSHPFFWAGYCVMANEGRSF